MEILLLVLIVGVLIVLANWIETREGELGRRLFNWLLLAFNLPFFFLGLLLLLVPDDLMSQAIQVEGTTLDLGAFGTWLVIMALWGATAALPGFRSLLARLGGSLNPASPVHATALVLAGYLVGNTLATLSQGGLEGLVLAAPEATIRDVIASQGLFVLVALLGVGVFVRRRGRDLVERLGLSRPTFRQLLLGTGAIFLLVVAQGLAGLLWSVIDPEQASLVEDIGVSLYGDFDTVVEWLILAAAAGIGEELLFRGALQPVFGLGATSLVFALSHFQYGLTPLALVIFALALVLGLIRKHTSTTVCMYVHGGYNFVLGLLVLLQPYLQQFAS